MRGRVKVKERVVEQPKIEACRHYWVIDVANGPSSEGECKFCGVRKEFFNAFPEFNPLKKRANPLAMPKIPGVEGKEEGNESLVSG